MSEELDEGSGDKSFEGADMTREAVLAEQRRRHEAEGFINSPEETSPERRWAGSAAFAFNMHQAALLGIRQVSEFIPDHTPRQVHSIIDTRVQMLDAAGRTEIERVNMLDLEAPLPTGELSELSNQYGELLAAMVNEEAKTPGLLQQLRDIPDDVSYEDGLEKFAAFCQGWQEMEHALGKLRADAYATLSRIINAI